MWGKIMIPMYRLWLHGLYGLHGPYCLLNWYRVAISNDKSTSWVPSLFCVSFLIFFSYMACMDYMDPDARCPKKAIKLNHSLTHLLSAVGRKAVKLNHSLTHLTPTKAWKDIPPIAPIYTGITQIRYDTAGNKDPPPLLPVEGFNERLTHCQGCPKNHAPWWGLML